MKFKECLGDQATTCSQCKLYRNKPLAFQNKDMLFYQNDHYLLETLDLRKGWTIILLASLKHSIIWISWQCWFSKYMIHFELGTKSFKSFGLAVLLLNHTDGVCGLYLDQRIEKSTNTIRLWLILPDIQEPIMSGLLW